MNSSRLAFETDSFPASLRESHQCDINGLSDKDKFKLLSAQTLDYIDQQCAVSIHVEGIYIPPELLHLLDHFISERSLQTDNYPRPLSLCVTTHDLFAYETFKQCVTTYLLREQKSDQNSGEQGNWTIMDRDYRTTVIIGYVFDGIEGYNVPSSVFENQNDFVRCLREQYQCLVSLACESSVFKVSSKLTVTIIHESPIIRQLASVHMQKSMMASVMQCEAYHINHVLQQYMSLSTKNNPAHLTDASTIQKQSTSKFSHDHFHLSNILNSAIPLSKNSVVESAPPDMHSVVTSDNVPSVIDTIDNGLQQHTFDNHHPDRPTGSMNTLFEIISDGNDQKQEEARSDADSFVDQHLFITQVSNLQRRFHCHETSVGEEFSRITSVLCIPPRIPLTETVFGLVVDKKKAWSCTLLLDDHLILARVCKARKKEAQRCAYDVLIHFLNNAHKFGLQPTENNKWKVINEAHK